MTTATVTELECHYCQRRRSAKPTKDGSGLKLPIGWKRERKTGAAVCRDCWKQRYVLRALTFPIASPEGGWKQLETDLRVMWAQTTSASNWMLTQCFVRDIRREPDVEKMPPMPPMYLYPEARVLFPNLPPQSVASLEQAVQRKYRAKRYEVVWTCAASLPTMRYPQPFPIHNQSWSFHFDDDNRPWVKCRIGANPWHLRLKSGPSFRRQITGLRSMAEAGEMAIYKAHDGTILCKLVGWLTRPAAKERSEASLVVRTGADHLLSAFDTKDERLWIENCDHLRRWIAEHARTLQRLSEDQKAEQRPVPSFAGRRTQAVEKQRHRIDSAVKEVAAHLAGFAQRRHFSRIVYDDRQRWLNPFPYFQLEQRIQTVLDEKGIVFEKFVAGDEGKEKSPDSPAKE